MSKLSSVRLIEGIPTHGLVFYADFAKHDGNVFPSDDTYGHTCTVSGALWGMNGRTFDGTDDSIIVPANTVLNFSNAFTIIMWIKPTAIVLNKYWLNKNQKIALYGVAAANTLRFDLDTSAGATNIQVVATPGAWQMITLSYDKDIGANNHKFYINTTVSATSNTGTVDSTAANNLIIGAQSAGTNTANGVINNFIAYSRQLSFLEIVNIYSATLRR